jgi:hypothetical protein
MTDYKMLAAFCLDNRQNPKNIAIYSTNTMKIVKKIPIPAGAIITN